MCVASSAGQNAPNQFLQGVYNGGNGQPSGAINTSGDFAFSGPGVTNAAAPSATPTPALAVDPAIVSARQNMIMNLQMASPTGGGSAPTGAK